MQIERVLRALREARVEAPRHGGSLASEPVRVGYKKTSSSPPPGMGAKGLFGSGNGNSYSVNFRIFRGLSL